MCARSRVRGFVRRPMGDGEATRLGRIEASPSTIATRAARQIFARDPRSEGNR